MRNSTGNTRRFIQSILTQEGVNRSLSYSNGICNDIHIVWESNRDKYWNIYYSNSIDKQIPFRLENKITDIESNSIMPSIDVNRNGTRMIAWHDDRDGNYNIYCARSLSGYECTQNNCEVNELKNFGNSVESCLLDFDYTATVTGFVHFAIDFYTDASMAEIFTTISSQDSLEGWSVDGVSFSDIQGVFLNIYDDYNISYVPQKNDNIFNQILYVKLRSIT